MQFKYIVATIASLGVTSVLAGPMPMPVEDNALMARAEQANQAHQALQANALKLAEQGKAGKLGEANVQAIQQRLTSAAAQFPSVRQWFPYCITPNYICNPGYLDYDFDFAFNFGFCGLW